MRHAQTILALFALLACKPRVEEPIDEEAYALCEALYDHEEACGADIEDDAAETCARNSVWQGPCRERKTAQFECYTNLTCEDTDQETEAFAACEAKLHDTGVCTAEHRDD